MASHRGQGGAEQARQLQSRVVGLVVHAVCPQPDAKHHRNDVSGVLSEGGKAHDGEDPPQRRAVEIPADQQDIRNADETVYADVYQNRRRTEHAQVITGGPAGGAEQTAVAGPHRPCGHTASEKAH